MSRKKRKQRIEEHVVEETGEAAAGEGVMNATAAPTPPSPESTEAHGTPELSELDRLRREADEMKTLALRKQADFENFRKRVERERAELSRYAGAEILRELLPVLDNLERAVRAGSSSTEEQLRAGIEIIQRQLSEILLRLGVSEVESLGLPFDPHVHEAVSRIETNDEPEGTILEVFQKGYWFKDRLLRPAMVGVAQAPESASAPEPGDGEETVEEGGGQGARH